MCGLDLLRDHALLRGAAKCRMLSGGVAVEPTVEPRGLNGAQERRHMKKDITRGPGASSLVLQPEERAEFLECIYRSCNKKQRLCRDPLAVVLRYEASADREVAGLICSMLAFGNVDLIVRACEAALEPLGAHPADSLCALRDPDVRRLWGNFQYRFCFSDDIIGFLLAIRRARIEYGSLENLFLAGDDGSGTVAAPAANFVRALHAYAPFRKNLLPSPGAGSACKRLFLFLRWMVRRDEVDPGDWTHVSPARLIVPLDVHMVRTCQDRLGFIPRGTGGAPAPTLRMALAVTAQFAEYSAGDPVKYDFALTRPGIDPRPGDDVFHCS